MSPLGTFSPGVFCPGHFWPGGLLAGGIFVRESFCPGGGLLSGGSFARGDFYSGGLCPFHQVQCVYEPSRLSVPSIVAWRTNKTKKWQTRPPSSAGSRPPLPKFSGYVEVEAHYILQALYGSDPFLRSYGRNPNPPPPKKADFAMKQTNICRLSGDITTFDINCNRRRPLKHIEDRNCAVACVWLIVFDSESETLARIRLL